MSGILSAFLSIAPLMRIVSPIVNLITMPTLVNWTFTGELLISSAGQLIIPGNSSLTILGLTSPITDMFAIPASLVSTFTGTLLIANNGQLIIPNDSTLTII